MPSCVSLDGTHQLVSKLNGDTFYIYGSFLLVLELLENYRDIRRTLSVNYT